MTDLPHDKDFFKPLGCVAPTEVEQVVVYAPTGARLNCPAPSIDRDGWIRNWINSGWRVADHRGRSLYLELAGA